MLKDIDFGICGFDGFHTEIKSLDFIRIIILPTTENQAIYKKSNFIPYNFSGLMSIMRSLKTFSTKNIFIFSVCIMLLNLNISVLAQIPTPVKPQQKEISIVGATIHIGNGEVIENGTITFSNGKITFVGKTSDTKISTEKENIIDATGKHVYPGLIAPNTTLGITEIEAARPTRDFNEVGEFNPNVRSLIAYNTDSRIIPTIRSNGILIAEIAPKGGIIAGTSSIVQLDAWNWEDAAYQSDIAIHLNWPTLQIRRGWWAQPEPSEANKKYFDAVKKIHDFFDDASAYHVQPSTEKNLKLEAMKATFSKNKKVLVHVSGAKEMMDVISFQKKYGIAVVIVGGEESWRVADMLKENNIPVILSDLHNLPGKPDDDIDITFKLPLLLKEAGVEFCLSLSGSWQVRNLPFISGTAVAHGLSKEEALKAITFSTAKILGIAHKTGTLETSKDANIIISEGDVLDMRSSIITYAFIQGRKIDLDNHQTQLYQKFSEKYSTH